MISIMVSENMNTGWLLSSIIRQTASVPFSGWYLLKRALVSRKKATVYLFALSCITLFERDTPTFERLFWMSFSVMSTCGASFRCLWSFELVCILPGALTADFNMTISPFFEG